MNSTNNTPPNPPSPEPAPAQSLHQRAEEKLRAMRTKEQPALTPADAKRTLHDLRVHQIELEMQNEELRRAQQELETSRARYFDLYDLAPVGYLTLNEHSLILEANLMAAKLLQTTVVALVHQPLTHFILPEDEDLYYHHRRQLFETGLPQTCELRLRRPDGAVFWARLDGTAARDAASDAPVCRVTMSDISEHRRADEALKQSAREIELRNRIAHVFLTVPDEEMYAAVLAIILEAMDSPLGVFGCLDEKGDLVVPTMTRTVWDKCQVPDKKSVFPRETWGQSSWPRAIREKRTICLNQPSTLTPAGHIAICRHISLPLIHQGEVVGLIQVANKTSDYTAGDIGLLETLGQKITPVLDARLKRERQEAARKQAETALREGEERFRALVSATAQIVWATDPAGHVTKDVPTWRAYTGQTMEECRGEGWADALHSDDRAGTLTAWHRAVESRSLYNIEYRARRHDGQYRYFLARGVPVLNADGSIREWVGYCADIHERKLAEARLSQERQLSETTLNDMPGLFCLVTEDSRPLRWNRSLETTSGYSGEEISRMRALDFFAEEHKGLVAAKILEAFKTGQAQVEVDLATKRGERLPFCFTASAITVDGQRCLIGMGISLVERKRAEESQARLATAIEQAAEAIMITDPAATIQYVNPAFEKTTGYTRQEIIGQNPRMLKSGKQDADYYRRMWAVLTAGEVWRGYLTNKRKDGTLFEEEKTISAVFDAAGQIINYVAVGRDVTHEAQLEAQLRQSQKMEAIGRLAGGVAHDFNNILTAILGHSDLALRRLGLDDPNREHLHEIRGAGERAAALTRQLLAFSRKQTLQPQVLNLNDLITNLAKMLKRLIGEDVHLATTLDPALGPVEADPGQIEQVITNLAVNARDAMPDGGTLTLKTANVELDKACVSQHAEVMPGRYAMLSLSDTGTGMAEEVKAHLFEPFFTTKEIGKGTGLGLASVHGIVTQSGGHLAVYSELGNGTTFKIYLPRVERVVEAAAAPRVSAELPHGTETVLLVEDEESVRKLASTVLNQCGYTVLEAANGTEAISVFKQHPGKLDLLLTDMIMPGLNGWVLAKTLQAVHARLRFLFMSGYTDTHILPQECVAEGAGFLQKPFSAEVLAHKVRETLDARR